jgi:hypothetical protein
MEQICDKYGKALKITRFLYANNERDAILSKSSTVCVPFEDGKMYTTNIP